MSEIIDNQEQRKQAIQDILRGLQQGGSLEEARAKFAASFTGVASTEIAAAEAALIADGVPVEEVQQLCSVHAALFDDAVEEAPVSAMGDADTPGHPLHTLKLENRATERLIENSLKPAIHSFSATGEAKERTAVKNALAVLADIKLHYRRKENLIFPYLEQHGVTAPPKVMWGVDDEIRAAIAAAIELCSDPQTTPEQLHPAIHGIVTQVREMISKEENILAPMALEALSPEEWERVAAESAEIGYCFITPPPTWRAPKAASEPEPTADVAPSGAITLPTGALQLDELSALFSTLPVDLAFVDADDVVRWYSQSEDRIFPRTNAVLGRKVVNCHPPASVHVVEGILADFKSGAKTHEDFWIDMHGKLIYIRYFAVHDPAGKYLGTLEVTQDVTGIRELQGEKRLVSE